jgi:MoxR-like ATPase
MNESQVSVDGQSLPLEPPFLIIATQNPFDFEGTYALPENQLDRFMLRIRIGYPDREHESRILRELPGRVDLDGLEPVLHAADVLALQEAASAVRVDDRIVGYILDLVEATRRHDQLRVGISPRGALALRCAAQAAALLDDRDYVVPDDIKSLVVPVFAHRLGANTHLYNGQARGIESLLADLLATIAVPG